MEAYARNSQVTKANLTRILDRMIEPHPKSEPGRPVVPPLTHAVADLVGCSKTDHRAAALALGIPLPLLRLHNQVFFGFVPSYAAVWPSLFVQAIPEKANLSHSHFYIVARILREMVLPSVPTGDVLVNRAVVMVAREVEMGKTPKLGWITPDISQLPQLGQDDHGVCAVLATIYAANCSKNPDLIDHVVTQAVKCFVADQTAGVLRTEQDAYQLIADIILNELVRYRMVDLQANAA